MAPMTMLIPLMKKFTTVKNAAWIACQTAMNSAFDWFHCSAIHDTTAPTAAAIPPES